MYAAPMHLSIGPITAHITYKRIKYLRLRLSGDDAELRISAPMRMSMKRIEAFTRSKLHLILAHQERIRRQARPVHRDTHLVLWGKEVPIAEVQKTGPSSIALKDGVLELSIRAKGQPEHAAQMKRRLIDGFIRSEAQRALEPMLDHWQQRMEVKPSHITWQHMRTRWGSCTPRTRRIRLSLALVKYPKEMLEYVLVHEMCHFFEGGHGPRFGRLMDRWLPGWRRIRQDLNKGASPH